MSEIFGAVGSIAGAAISANATQEATETQIKALERQKQFVFDELNPTKISGFATAQDVERTKNRLALQGIVDPALLRTRYAAQDKLEQQLGALGGGPSEAIADQAAQEALQPREGFDTLKKRLIDDALSELESGATLPPDLQAELVKAGLEKSGMVSGAASPRGVGGAISRKLIGEAGLNLKAQRQGRAIALGQAAQALESERSRLLGTLFPALKQQEIQNIGATSGALAQSNQMVPEAGLGGTDIAQLWLSRVGAANQLSQSAADVASRGAVAQGQILNTGIGQATGYAASAFPSTQKVFGSLFS